jgi:glycosyltransferase involved in cell wall biosynthesis
MSDALRVLFVCGSAPPIHCGVGDYSACLARALGSYDGVHVGLMTTQGPDRAPCRDAFEGVDLIQPFSHWSLQNFFAARRTVLQWQPDILHVQWPAQGYDGPLIGILPQWFRRVVRRPVALTLHEHIPAHVRSIGARLMAPAAHAVISVRPNFPEGFQQGLSAAVASKPFHFIPNASQIPLATPTPAEIECFRHTHNIGTDESIVVYFGLLYPDRGVEQLFSIADPLRHRLFIVGGPIAGADSYYHNLASLGAQPQWRNRVTLMGFVPSLEAAFLLAVADAVVLPFRKGGGIWNTSIHAARSQGTFVLTTSRHHQGYDATRNIFWAEPDNIPQLQHALHVHLGTRRLPGNSDVPQWPAIAAQHRVVYNTLLRRGPP